MSKKSRRSIVVEGKTYLWAVAPAFVYIWDEARKRQSFPCCLDAITPRHVADAIYRLFLNRQPPPRPVTKLHVKVPEPVMVPFPAPDLFVLQKTHYQWNGYGSLIGDTPQIIAGFVDPQLAKVQAARLNAPYGDALKAVLDQGLVDKIRWHYYLRKDGETGYVYDRARLKQALLARLEAGEIPAVPDFDRFFDLLDGGFTLFSATTLPVYETVLGTPSEHAMAHLSRVVEHVRTW